MKHHRKVYVRKDYMFAAAPWTVRLFDTEGREAARAHLSNGKAALGWARLFLSPAEVMADIWDEATAAAGRDVLRLYGDPINPYRSLAQRARRAERR